MYETDELYHYGVLGMKWGVRRATKKLSNATTTEQRDKAIGSLNKHLEKSQNKVKKLNARIDKLEKQVSKDEMHGRKRAMELSRQAARLRKKTHSPIRIYPLDGVREWRASQLDNRSERQKLRIETTKSNLLKSKNTKRLFQEGIQTIDKTLIDNGRKILNG